MTPNRLIPPRNAHHLADDQMAGRLYDAIHVAWDNDRHLLVVALQALLDELQDGGEDATWTPTQVRSVLAEVLL